jgi:tetratricopeptide (TPR) repeat protein
VSIYNDLLRRYPDFPLAEKKLAALYVDDPHHIDEAYRLATKARSLLPDDAELASILGEISFKRGEFSYAIQYFQESARRRPLSARNLYYCGMAQLRENRDSESLETLEKAVSLGLAELMLKDAQEAIGELRRRSGP